MDESKLKFMKIGIAMLSVIILLLGVVYLSDQGIITTFANRKIPIYSVDTPEKKVALSFDAAWGNDDTHTLLSILDKYNIKTTFFLVGGWVERYPEDVKAIADAGHDIGNHSTTHKHMTQISKAENINELMTVHQQIKAITGKDMDLFRPPYGDYDNKVIDAATERGYYVIQWDIDSLDWRDYGRDSIVRTVLDHPDLRNGSIILLHNNAKYTKDALEDIIIGLIDKDYRIVPISELIYRDNYTIDHTGRQISNK